VACSWLSLVVGLTGNVSWIIVANSLLRSLCLFVV
jgi:hypothetical protein